MHHLSRILLAVLFALTATAHAQTGTSGDYADPAFRSPVVAVEFTGQRCRYCPNLSRALKGSESLYGPENYIITALHSLEEYSALPGNHVSLFHPEAREYAASIKVHDGLPQLAYNTLGPTVSDLHLDEMFRQDDLLECTGNVYVGEGRQFVLDIRTRLRRNQQHALQGKQIDILFWALENDIVALQDDNGRFTYPAHEHIFRGSINGTWGESYTVGTPYRRTLPIPAAVGEVEHTDVVVFFLDHATRTILDAGRFKVNPVLPTGVGEVLTDIPQDRQPLYDLSGRRVTHPVPGEIYLSNGRKYQHK